MSLKSEAAYLYIYSKELTKLNKELKRLSKKAQKHADKHSRTDDENKKDKHRKKHSKVKVGENVQFNRKFVFFFSRKFTNWAKLINYI